MTTMIELPAEGMTRASLATSSVSVVLNSLRLRRFDPRSVTA